MSRLRCATNEVLRASRGPPSSHATCSTASQLAMCVCDCTDRAVESDMTMGASSPPLTGLRSTLLLLAFCVSP
ncbi:UNVERIFIED_CONTAM: hypothetical protein Sangu_2831300 [Sesamum angustifolium]|uniref:Uncharacterized protein n=1 Tax=Sesamum angustifolium TaxID=2727405 RepID=A0AAW2IPR6_9LAMI